MGATFTESYSRGHRALLECAAGHGSSPHELRILVALVEADGYQLNTAQLADQLSCDGGLIRRYTKAIAEAGWARHDGVDGKRPRPGTRSRLTLTDRGREIAHDVLLLAGTELP